ncbi:MAG: response regulator [Proteobacteria bacterium]|nr:response regulator [Pseudomonadota bacterium]
MLQFNQDVHLQEYNKMGLAPAIAKKNILIIEDSISMRHTIKASLRTQGFENLIEADNGKKALVLIGKKNIDLAISDWMMPKYVRSGTIQRV